LSSPGIAGWGHTGLLKQHEAFHDVHRRSRLVGDCVGRRLPCESTHHTDIAGNGAGWLSRPDCHRLGTLTDPSVCDGIFPTSRPDRSDKNGWATGRRNRRKAVFAYLGLRNLMQQGTPEEEALRTRVYIDGYNLYYGCLKKSPHKWLDVRALTQRILANIPYGRDGVPMRYRLQTPAIKYFTADILKAFARSDDSAPCQEHYHSALSGHLKRRNASSAAPARRANGSINLVRSSTDAYPFRCARQTKRRRTCATTWTHTPRNLAYELSLSARRMPQRLKAHGHRSRCASGARFLVRCALAHVPQCTHVNTSTPRSIDSAFTPVPPPALLKFSPIPPRVHP
jgi:hypothetical protein